MKNLLISITIIFFSAFCCKVDNSPNLNDYEWSDILDITLSFTNSNQYYVLKEYDNVELKKAIVHAYKQCTHLGYIVSDSILQHINSRINSPITNKLDTMFNVKFVSEGDELNKDIIKYSEPVKINKDLIIMSMSYTIINKRITFNKIFFFKKLNGRLKLIEFYDVNKDKYFKASPL